MDAARWRKKRLTALAEWHFGGGGDYCAACKGDCPECPRKLNAPQTLEGEQVWRLALRCGGQIRAGAMGGVFGLDMTAVLALARASGIEPIVAAELMPAVEAVMVSKLRERNSD